MILTPRELEDFENFSYEEMQDKQDPNFTATTYALPGKYDIITIKYYKKTKGIFGRIVEKEWSKKIEFKRVESSSDKIGYTNYAQNTECTELMTQLQTMRDEGIEFISREDYEFFKSEHPDRFI